MSNPQVALALFAENSAETVDVTLDSFNGVFHKLLVLDSGNAECLGRIKEWSDKESVPMVTYNSTDYATFFEWVNEQSDIDFVLTPELGEKLENNPSLRTFLKNEMNEEEDKRSSGFRMTRMQHQLDNGNLMSWCEVCLFRPKCGWVYRNSKLVNDAEDVKIVTLPPEINLGSDISFKDEHVVARLQRRYDLLKDASSLNDMFELAETSFRLSKDEEAYDNYKKCLELGAEGEELFQCLLHLGALSTKLSKPVYEIQGWYMGAYTTSRRVEPLLFLSNSLVHEKDYNMAFGFAQTACTLGFPPNTTLPVEVSMYSHKRWAHMAISGFHVGAYPQALEAAERAHKISQSEKDAKLIELIQSKMGETSQRQKTPTFSKDEWITQWKKANSRLPTKIRQAKAEKAWLEMQENLKKIGAQGPMVKQ
jgi:tetratricopeptide (TPR) repeat protein